MKKGNMLQAFRKNTNLTQKELSNILAVYRTHTAHKKRGFTMKKENMLQAFRKNTNMTQKELSNILAVSLSSIQKYESGERQLPPELANKLVYYDTEIKRATHELEKLHLAAELALATSLDCESPIADVFNVLNSFDYADDITDVLSSFIGDYTANLLTAYGSYVAVKEHINTTYFNGEQIIVIEENGDNDNDAILVLNDNALFTVYKAFSCIEFEDTDFSFLKLLAFENLVQAFACKNRRVGCPAITDEMRSIQKEYDFDVSQALAIKYIYHPLLTDIAFCIPLLCSNIMTNDVPIMGVADNLIIEMLSLTSVE